MKSLEQHLNESLEKEVNESLLGGLLFIGGCVVGYNYVKKITKQLLNKLDETVGEWWSNRVVKKSEALNAEMNKLMTKYPHLATKIKNNYPNIYGNKNAAIDWLSKAEEVNTEIADEMASSDKSKYNDIINKTNDVKNEIISKFKNLDMDSLNIFSKELNSNVQELKNLESL
jgi:hypothetical protein